MATSKARQKAKPKSGGKKGGKPAGKKPARPAKAKRASKPRASVKARPAAKRSKAKAVKAGARSRPKAGGARKSAAKVAKRKGKATVKARSAARPVKRKSAAKAPPKSRSAARSRPAPKGKARPARRGRATGRPAAPAIVTPPAKPTLKHIDARTLGKIIGKLQEMRAESQGIVNQQVMTDLTPREEASDVGDDLDQASSERDREFSLIMHQRHLRRLQQIDEAFERIQDGSYGLCEGTDEPINPKRLLIMPLARYSLEYQEQQEKMMGRTMESEGVFEGEDSFTADD